jgi:hypothetical protein
MKLRIRGNSIRLRLSQGDIAVLVATGAIEDRVSFGPHSALTYRLERAEGPQARAALTENRLIVAFPPDQIDTWAQTEAVSMEAEQALDDTQGLNLLVEKDFQCLSPREAEDDADLFPNPGSEIL